MKGAIRCCISCIFPCGTLDVVRIVHASGRVEEISGVVTAGEIMQAYPKHVLRKPPSASMDGVVEAPKAVILPPEAELRRGKLYFLMPVSSEKAMLETRTTTRTTRKRRSWKKKEGREGEGKEASSTDKRRLLPEIVSEKASAQRNRRRGRVGVWRPHLESISEVSSDL